MVVFGIFQGGQMDWFIDPPSLAITIGGTIGCLIASYPLSYLAGLGKRFKLVFMPKKFNPEKYIDDIVEYAKIARGRGLLALEESANQCTDQFMKSALMLIVDANDTAKVRGMLDDAISFMCERHDNGRAFFEKGVAVFPAFGMLGTVVGLVNMLNTMDSNPEGLADGMATALITTFYGSLFANVLFNPMASALQMPTTTSCCACRSSRRASLPLRTAQTRVISRKNLSSCFLQARSVQTRLAVNLPLYQKNYNFCRKKVKKYLHFERIYATII